MSELSTIVAAEKSTHECPVFIVPVLEKHPNADLLSMFKIPDSDYLYLCSTSEWENRVGQLAAWIPPDSLADTTKEQLHFMAHEAKYDEEGNPDKTGLFYRVRAKKIRLIVSYGLCVPLPADCGLQPGDNAVDYLNIKHYEAPIAGEPRRGGGGITSGEVESPPKGLVVYKYDVDAFLKYGRKLFVEGEPIIATLKIHGANARYVWNNDRMYCSSRTEFKKEFATPPSYEDLLYRIKDEAKAKAVYERLLGSKKKRNMWWEALTPQMEEFCKAYPNHVAYFEIYGQVQKGFPYDALPNTVKARAFDILKPDASWMEFDEMKSILDKFEVPMAPIIFYNHPFNFDELVNYVENMPPILNLNSIEEGIVVQPMLNRYDPRLGRVKLKIVSSKYSERN